MMDKIVLGLLSKKDLTVYDIKIAMDKSISKFYSNSFGSINPAIKKLEQLELIKCTERIEKSRLKKTYSITKQGEEVYSDWVSQPIQQGRIKDEVLIRIFFLGDTDAVSQKNLINEYLDVLNESKKDLEKVQSQINQMDLSAEDRRKVKFQLSTLQFGIDYMEFKRNWFHNLLNEI